MFLGATACNDTPAGEATQISDGPPAAISSSETTTSTGTSTGTVFTSVGRYIFTPTHCAIGVEEGLDDIEIGGPGKSPDEEPIYVEFSSTGDALDIQLGVDRPFTTSEHKLVAGRSITQPIEFSVSGKTVRATGISLANGQGKVIDNEASFQIDCSPAV